MKITTLVATTAATALMGFSALATTAHAEEWESVDHTIMEMAGEFELGNGETHSIAHQKTEKEYRICVKKARHSVPLKVMYDGKEDVVAAGNCTDFEAMNIKVAPAAKLDNDMVIIGKYRHL